MQSGRKAIVIGGGIGGLAAAISLQNMGIEVAVFDRSHALQAGGAGLTLWPNATRSLEKLGVLEEVLAETFESKRVKRGKKCPVSAATEAMR